MKVPTVYGTEWCPDCQALGRFLGAHRFRYQWVDRDPAARTFLERAHGGKQVVPTLGSVCLILGDRIQVKTATRSTGTKEPRSTGT